jgi:CheY-like chemotaxis protein
MLPSNFKVLVAEDSPIHQIFIKKVLDNLRINTEIASDGKQAIEKLINNHFDLILMDLDMPEMNGFETTRFIRSEMPSPKSNIPIIALTALNKTEEINHCFNVGIDDYLEKPVIPQLLEEKIFFNFSRVGIRKEPSNIIPISGNQRIVNLSFLISISQENNAFLLGALKLIIKELPVYSQSISEILSHYQFENFELQAQHMKTSLSYIGLNDEARKIHWIKKNYRDSKNRETITLMLHEVAASIKTALTELKAEIEDLKELA